MTDTVTIAGTPYVATLAETRTFETRRRSRHVFHSLLGTADEAIALRPASRRSGTLRLLFATKATAVALESALATAAIATYTSTTHSDLNMTFAPRGDIRLRLDPRTLTAWWVEVDYQAVS